MNYEMLYQAIRIALELEVVEYDEFSTDTKNVKIERHGRTLWHKWYSRYDLVEGSAVEDYIVSEIETTLEAIGDEIVKRIDWRWYFELAPLPDYFLGREI